MCVCVCEPHPVEPISVEPFFVVPPTRNNTQAPRAFDVLSRHTHAHTYTHAHSHTRAHTFSRGNFVSSPRIFLFRHGFLGVKGDKGDLMPSLHVSIKTTAEKRGPQQTVAMYTRAHNVTCVGESPTPGRLCTVAWRFRENRYCRVDCGISICRLLLHFSPSDGPPNRRGFQRVRDGEIAEARLRLPRRRLSFREILIATVSVTGQSSEEAVGGRDQIQVIAGYGNCQENPDDVKDCRRQRYGNACRQKKSVLYPPPRPRGTRVRLARLFRFVLRRFCTSLCRFAVAINRPFFTTE